MGRSYKKVPVIKEKEIIYKRKGDSLIVSLKTYIYLKSPFKKEYERYVRRKLSKLVSPNIFSQNLGYCTFTLDDFEEGEIPTWEQVFEWFREKGLHSFIKVFCTNLEFDKRDAERLKNPITFYKYVKGKDALGTFSFSIQNYSEISSYNTFGTYEKCREELVKSLIDDYKKLKIK